MKNLTRLFMAVAAVVFAFSCVTDPTADQTVQLDNNPNGEVKSVISVAIADSKDLRTHLGELANQKYPLYWSEGDKISVNGVTSEAVPADYVGKSFAEFTAPVQADVYRIAYPAAADNTVVFEGNQTHTSVTTFGDGVAVMYGYCSAGEGVSLQHLTGVLKVGVNADADGEGKYPTLAYAQISTVDRTPIAGVFNLDFETGVTTPSESAIEVISYSFGEGVTLSKEATYLHIVVPAGVYDELYVTLYDKEGGVMSATVTANDEKPLEAGQLRTFKNTIKYAATDKVFVVKSAQDLLDFAAAAPTLDKNMLLVQDVDMTGKAWTPINGYSKTVLGNGYSIKGLTAPLFGTTSASFKGLHLTGVNIAETANPNVGAFARNIVATESITPTFEHCSASGTLSVNCTSYTVGSNDKYTSFAIGGLVGYVCGVDIADCTSKVSIDVDQVQASGNALVNPCIGGVVGYVSALVLGEENVVCADIHRCENSGSIDVAEMSTASSTFSGKTIDNIGGVVGYIHTNNAACEAKNLTNRGNVSVSRYLGNGANAVGGVIGYANTAAGENLTNYGSVSYSSGKCHTLNIGGVVGYGAASAKLHKLYNHGTVSLPEGGTPEKTTIAYIYCGGVVGQLASGSELRDSSNNNAVTVKCVTNGSTSASRPYLVGGVVAFSDGGSVQRCYNNQGGTITCEGTIANIYNWKDVCIGGVVGRLYSRALAHAGNDANINVNLTVAAANAATTGLSAYLSSHNRVHLGGVVGLNGSVCKDANNTGNITVAGSYGALALGGVAGDWNSNANDEEAKGYSNTGSITVSDNTVVALTGYIGGVIGSTVGYIYEADNSGAININRATFKGNTHIGGCVGLIESRSNTATVSDAENSGAINFNEGATFKNWLIAAGCVGRANSGSVVNDLTNNAGGAINIGKATFSYISLFGGCLAYMPEYDSGDGVKAAGTITTVTNNAPISVAEGATFGNSPYFGGCVGLAQGAIDTATNEASGAITINKNTIAFTVYVGGVVARTQTANGTLKNATNNAPLAIGFETTVDTGLMYFGGIAGNTAGAAVDTADNYGTVTVSSNDKFGRRYIAGICPLLQAGGSDLTNHATATITATVNNPSYTYLSGVAHGCNAGATNLLNQGAVVLNGSTDVMTLVGGVFGDSKGAFTYTNVRNEGAITINAASTGQLSVSGLQADTNTNQTWKSCYNSGAITLSATANCSGNTYVGGLFARIRNNKIVNTFSGCYNTGAIVVEKGAKTTSATTYIGGLIGEYGHNASASMIVLSKDAANLYNTGNITVSNEADNVYVGGAVGYTRVPLNNVNAVCYIKCYNMSKLGMISGNFDDTKRATYCHAGGSIDRGQKTSIYDENEDDFVDVYVDAPVPLTKDTYYNYIYGVENAISAATAATDHCGYIESVTSEPQYAN